MSDSKPLWRRFELSPEGVRTLKTGEFLRLETASIRNVYQDNSKSRWFRVETARSPFSDAVVLLLHHTPAGFRASAEKTMVLLRRSPRPAAWLRTLLPNYPALPELDTPGAIWELPAGGVEPEDLATGGRGIKGRALREAREETGFSLSRERLASLGPAPYTAPAFSQERLHYFASQVEPDKAGEPCGDGHPLETGADLRFVSLATAFQWCRSGAVIDLKTEVGLHRLAEHLHFGPA